MSLVGTTTATFESQYDTVVDVVEAGADPTGSEPIDDVIADYDYQDDTLIKFPEGRYLANNLDFTDCQNYALRAVGDATLVPGPDYDTDVWIGGSGLRNFRFEGFTIDNTAEGHHPTVAFSAWDDLVVRDVHKKGLHDGNNTAFGFSIWNEDGSGYIENLEAPDGSIPQTTVATYVNTNGEITFRDCHIEGFGNNGLYASSSNGPVHVEGGVYKNNDIAQVRLGSPGSSVKNATIGVDEPYPEHDNSRGVRISDGPGPVTIENCDIFMERGEGGGGVVGAFSGGGFTLRDSRIYVGPEYTTVGSGGAYTSPAILVDEPTGVDDPGSRTIENTAITGGGTEYSAALFRRGDNTIEDVCVHQTGSERHGLVFTEQSHDNVVANSTIDVPGKTIVGRERVDATDVDREGTCSLPSPMADEDEEPEPEPEPESEPEPDTDTGPPLPGWLDNNTYGVMGTDADNPTATVYGNFKCPYTRGFMQGNFQDIRTEFVETGELNVRYRDVAFHPSNPNEPYLLDHSDNELVSQVGLGVWDVEPENYWQFVEYVFANQSAVDWTSFDDLEATMRDAGIRNHGKVRVFVEAGWYQEPVHETAADAADFGLDFVPQLELDGDAIPPHHDTETVLDWIEARL